MISDNLGFGKHCDKTYDEVAEHYPRYISWIVTTFSPTDPRWIAANAARLRDIQTPPTHSLTTIEPNHFGNGKKMMDFQKAGLAFTESTGGNAMIADQMGLGKTIQALA